MDYIKRFMEEIFFKLNEQYPAILITGPRQVGKTTMLQKLMKLEGWNRHYVSLDDLNVRALAKSGKAIKIPEKKMIGNFSVIEKSPLKRGVGAIICTAEKLGAFDRDNLIIPISLL